MSQQNISNNSKSVEMADDRIESMFPESGFLKDVPPNVLLTWLKRGFYIKGVMLWNPCDWIMLLVTWGKKFQDNVVAKGYLCSTSQNRGCYLGAVSWNVLSIKWALIWVIAELCTVFQTRVITKAKQLIRKISWILWRSPLFQLLFLATRSTKESSFDLFKLHSPLFK